MLGIGQKGKTQRVLGIELGLFGTGVWRDADDGSGAQFISVFSLQIAQQTALGGTSGRIGLRIEVHAHVAPLVRRELDGGSVLVNQIEVGRCVSKCEHERNLPSAHRVRHAQSIDVSIGNPSRWRPYVSKLRDVTMICALAVWTSRKHRCKGDLEYTAVPPARS